ncbi:MAG: hypothetical protein A3F72_16775 [Bacteroidetes bacterium RIFCSPLOWO2_12_FULL_35_15]|nr:MAG: hypothetical protein A3F72_16775 [Bacteroidetes bacterium RIFCSPLOWO2_12_FULL_35_15]
MIKSNNKKLLNAIYILIINIAFTTNVYSQAWCPPGATWHYGYSVWMTSGYYKVSYIGDTIIGSITCKILEKKNYVNVYAQSADTISLSHEYTYADANKVYIYRFNNFYTLYDFSANPGDTIIVPGTNKYSSSGCDSIGAVRVDSVGIVNINGENLRYISVSPTPTSKWGWNCRIVEKTGPFGYLFPEKNDYCGMMIEEIAEGGNLRCYSDDLGFSYFKFDSNNPTCDYIFTGINENKNRSNEFIAYPNPANDEFKITFHLDQSQIAILVIYDLTGSLVISKTLDGNSDITEVSTSNLIPGLYIYKLNVNNTTVNAGKLSIIR